MHFIQCTARHLQVGYIKRRREFKHTHGKLRTAKVIYEGFMHNFIPLRRGGTPPSNVTHFDSKIDKLVQRAWEEQKAIGWDQMLKGRISKYWGLAQGLYYRNNPDTKGKAY